MLTEPVPVCPACGGDGAIAIRDAQDYVTQLPGTWTFRRCERCQSLWQDPCTSAEDIPKLYPQNYLFTRDPAIASDLSGPGFKASLKKSLLEKLYGYPVPTPNTFGLAQILAIVPSMRARIGRNVRYLPRIENGRLLDVGCGNGAFLQQMRKLGWQVEGIEPDPKAAAIASSRGLDVTQGTLETADLRDNYYDAITMSHVMEHFKQPQVAIERVAACLKPNGIFVSMSPNPVGWLSKFFGDKWYELDAPRHLSIPSPDGYRMMCEKAGLRATYCTTHILTYWILRYSLGIRRTAKAEQSPAKIGPKLFSIVSSWLLPLFPESGEEVVCCAVKR